MAMLWSARIPKRSLNESVMDEAGTSLTRMGLLEGRRAALLAVRRPVVGNQTMPWSSRGVSDPPRLPPIMVPLPERGGSLTPRRVAADWRLTVLARPAGLPKEVGPIQN
jgi:hypothetical protein